MVVADDRDRYHAAVFDQGVTAGALERKLKPGEQILWRGRPDPKRHFTRGEVIRIPFSVLWAALMVSIGFSAVQGGSHYLKLLCVPFVLAALYVTIGRFWWQARVKRRTTYAITDRRVIVAVEGSSRRTRSIRLNRLPPVNPVVRSDGSGDIVFGTMSLPEWISSATRFGVFSSQRNAGLVGFYDLPDAQAPLALLKARLPPLGPRGRGNGRVDS
jgi:hypothetical protein